MFLVCLDDVERSFAIYSGCMFPHPMKVFESSPVFKLLLNCLIFTNLGNYLSYLQNDVVAESVDHKFQMLDYVKIYVAD